MIRRSALLLIFLAPACLAAACAGPKRLRYESVSSPAMHGSPMAYAAYLPPGFSLESGAERLPLIVFLHGGGDDVSCFDGSGIGQLLDAALADGTIPTRAVVVVPQGDRGFWADWHDGTRNYESWVVNDLLPEVRRRFHTADGRADTHVCGISMGGNGALRMALHHPDVFASCACLSGPIFDAEQIRKFMDNWFFRYVARSRRIFGPADDVVRRVREDLYRRWTKPADLQGVRLYLAVGDDDRRGIPGTNQRFHEHLLRCEIPHTWRVFRGGHTWTAWKPLFVEVVRFHLEGGSSKNTSPKVPISTNPTAR